VVHRKRYLPSTPQHLLSLLTSSILANKPDGPRHLAFDPEVASLTTYDITSYQPTYFVASSFASLKDQILMYCSSPTHFSARPFAVRYNALTERVEVLDSKERLVRFARQVVRGDLGRLVGAVERM